MTESNESQTDTKTAKKKSAKKSAKKTPKKKKAEKGKDLDPIEAAIAEIEDELGEGTIQYGEGTYVAVEVVHTGVASLDVALGVGGVPRGRIIEIYGAESGGKTTLALQTIAACQQGGGVAAFIDVEHALDPMWASKMGVDMDKLIISQPDNGEDAIRIVETLVNHGVIDIIVVDSVAALIPKEELDGEVDDTTIASQARLMSKAMRRLAGKSLKTRTAIIFINQLRDKVGQQSFGFARPEQTPGGRALKFYSSVRMEVKRTELIKQKEKPIAARTRVKIVKSKVSPPFRTAEFEIHFGADHQEPEPIFGIETSLAVMYAAIDRDVLEQRGSNYYLDGGARLAAGKEKLLEFIREDPELKQKLTDRIYDTLNNQATSKDTPEPEDSVVEETDDSLPDDLMDLD